MRANKRGVAAGSRGVAAGERGATRMDVFRSEVSL